jgi:hypothetical protein
MQNVLTSRVTRYFCKVERRYYSPYSDQNTGWKTGKSYLISGREKRFFFSEAFRRIAGPSHSPNHWEWEALSLGIKRPGREAGNLPSPRAFITNKYGNNFTPQYTLMAGTRTVLSLLK